MSSPSQPRQIARPTSAASSPGSGYGVPLGTSPARAAFAGTPPVPNIPARAGTPRGTPGALGLPGTPGSLGSRRGSTPGGPARPASTFGGGADTPTPGAQVDVDELSDEAKAKVLRRHLATREERGAGVGVGALALPSGTGSRRGSDVSGVAPAQAKDRRLSHAAPREDSEAFPIPFEAPGADTTHEVYKWATDRRRLARPRSASYAGAQPSRAPAFANIHEPNGFRRNYVLTQAEREGVPKPRMLRSFVEFIYVFGHFAGEDLEEIDEEDEEDELADEDEDALERGAGARAPPAAAYSPADGLLARPGAGAPKPGDERAPLLAHRPVRSMSRRGRGRTRSASVAHTGDATVTQAVLMLVKGFVGTGILFLGKAFMNGGILFSVGLLSFIALVSLYSFLLLVKAKFAVGGSFGDIGGALYGPWMRYAILSSIVVSQLGFVSAYIIFVSENLQAFVAAITDCARILPIQYMIAVQIVVFLPLALVRNLARLSTTALVADVFIIAGLIYIFGSEAKMMAGTGPGHVELFNPKDWTLMIGTAIFSFEGIGLVIPVTDAMREPHKFPKVLTGVMISLMFLFAGGGAMSYLTFGPEVKTVVLLNLPDSRTLQVVQFLYSAAILLSVPLQLFPAVRIMETGLFKASGKGSPRVKWTKNAFRAAIVCVCALVSYVGAADLDKFVALIGSFACVPLCYVYPPMLHLRACARTRRERAADWALIVFGCVAAVYTTAQTLRLILEPAVPGDGSIGRCPAPAANPFM